jgi:transposase
MFVIGIDPHQRSHTAAVLDDSGELVGQLRLNADRWQRDRLLRFAAPFEPRIWAVEAAGGLGALLAQQLVGAGECVVDVPPTLSARVRLLDAGRTDKSDRHDARSAAIVALRHARLRPGRPVDHSAVLRVLANRHHDLTASRTRRSIGSSLATAPERAAMCPDRECRSADGVADLMRSDRWLGSGYRGASKRCRSDRDRLRWGTVMWNSSGWTSLARSRFG